MAQIQKPCHDERRSGYIASAKGETNAPGEFERIAAFARLVPPQPGVVVGIGDDAAVLSVGTASRWLATQDCLIEDIHFRRTWTTPQALGRKALAVSLSDIAAMGGTPKFALATLALPVDVSPEWAVSCMKGLVDRAAPHNVALVGGDTVRSPGPIMVDVCVIGEAPTRPSLRSGAQPGDILAVTGPVGGAAAGLRLLEGEVAESLAPFDRDILVAAFWDPPARIAEGRRLADHAHALVDLSDGLAGAVYALSRSSGLGCVLDAERIPLSPALIDYAAALDLDPLEIALRGGEDYELCAALAPNLLPSPGRINGVFLYPIGHVTTSPQRTLRRPNGLETPLTEGYDAFAE